MGIDVIIIFWYKWNDVFRYCSPKFRFDQTFRFSPIFDFLTKISIFDQIIECCPKFRFLTKIVLQKTGSRFWIIRFSGCIVWSWRFEYQILKSVRRAFLFLELARWTWVVNLLRGFSAQMRTQKYFVIWRHMLRKAPDHFSRLFWL